jgi:hypothetical protein
VAGVDAPVLAGELAVVALLAPVVVPVPGVPVPDDAEGAAEPQAAMSTVRPARAAPVIARRAMCCDEATAVSFLSGGSASRLAAYDADHAAEVGASSAIGEIAF